MLLHTRPETTADLDVAPEPAMMVPPDAILPYPLVGPYSKLTVVAALLSLTDPFSVALVARIAEAKEVATAGAIGEPINVAVIVAADTLMEFMPNPLDAPLQKLLFGIEVSTKEPG
jgi:hypothetical protein